MDAKISGRIIIIVFLLTICLGICLIFIPSAKPKAKEQQPFAGTDIKSLLAGGSQLYPKDTIAVLNIFSPISYDSQDEYFGLRRSGAIYWIDLLDSIEDNPNIKALVIRMNSPGGTVAATQEVYNKIKRLREKGKIVLVSMGDIAASGAYYIASAADYIVANPGTLTGSIGVIMSGMDLSELFKKFGVGFNVIKSGKNKDIMSSYRKMTPEEYQLLENVVMDTYDQFFKAVSQGRKIKPEDLKPLADGSIFTGRQALKNKLVDELGDFEQAVNAASKLANIKGKPNIIELKPEPSQMWKILTSSIETLGQPKKDIHLIENPVNKIQGNYSPLLYMYEL